MSKQEMRQKLFDEFDYKQKAGTAWSHNYLNQKPWHPLSYPNQRRKWIAEQMHGVGEKRKSEVEKEFQKEQDFIKQSALLSKKQRQKVQAMQSVSFMYTKPPGYNAESARAAELAEEERQKRNLLEATSAAELAEGELGLQGHVSGSVAAAQSPAQLKMEAEAESRREEEALVLAKSGPLGGESSEPASKKKKVPRDVFGNKIATEEDFDILKNAPRVDTGIIGRAKPFGIELRNVKCGRCGAVGHQSGDRECPLRDSVTEGDIKRQQREDPLSLILVHNRSQGLSWEPKQSLGGISPPRGGFRPEDDNQQILAPIDDEEGDLGLVDQYGGFLNGSKGDPDPALEGVSEAVLAALTKQQRKELRRVLKEKRKDEKRKLREGDKERESGKEHGHKRKCITEGRSERVSKSPSHTRNKDFQEEKIRRREKHK